MTWVPLMTLPLAVFLKNFLWVTTASARGRLRMVISTMVGVGMRQVLGKFRSSPPIGKLTLEGQREQQISNFYDDGHRMRNKEIGRDRVSKESILSVVPVQTRTARFSYARPQSEFGT
jgi:hypothetical protein